MNASDTYKVTKIRQQLPTARFHSNLERNRWEELRIVLLWDSGHEGVHTYTKFHQAIHCRFIFQFVNHT